MDIKRMISAGAAAMVLGASVIGSGQRDLSPEAGISAPLSAVTASAAGELSGTLISSAEILDTDYAESWGIDPSLEVGDPVFGDRTTDRCAVRELPEELKGAELLLTPCDAKNSDKAQARVTAARYMTLYVGLDRRVSAIPQWLYGWHKEDYVLGTSNDVTFELYTTTLRAGQSLTLGANGQSQSVMNYIVMAVKADGLAGDVNLDGVFNIADLVLFQKWLLAVPDTELGNWQAADLCEDERLNVFDLIRMKSDLADPPAVTTTTVTTAPPPTTTTVRTTVPFDQRSYSFTVDSKLFDQSDTDTLSLSEPKGLETVTVWKAGSSGDHYCNGVCLAAYKGKLYCQWQSSATDEDSADTHVMYSVSSDGGRTWSEATVLAKDMGAGYCTSGGWYAAEDRLVAYINYWPDELSDPRGGFAYYMTSSDGSSWSAPQQVTMADGSVMKGVFEQDPHILESGRIINAAHFQDGLTVCPIYTDDPSGVSGWRKGSFSATPNGAQSLELEPSSFVQSDGTLVMIFRDQSSSYKKLASYSFDDGATWSKAQLTDMPDARTKQSAGNLSDGTAFMAGCPVNSSLRSPLAVTVSADGKSFTAAYLLRSGQSDPELIYEGKAKRKGFHYTKSLVDGGYLYVGYATNKEAVEISIVPEASLIQSK
ncbi:MAG: exo-alpha-sialidase [Ruminococcus sp.]|nr:exo-alpha-sialidase [Ruminococcus sp.]